MTNMGRPSIMDTTNINILNVIHSRTCFDSFRNLINTK